MKTALAMLALSWIAASPAQEHYAPGIREVATLPARVFAWSPDGKRLAYAVDRSLWIVDAPEFRSPRRLPLGGWGRLPNRDEEKEYPIQQIRWSPDGGKLAFVSSRAGDGWYTVWLADAEGSQVRDLLPPDVSHIFGSPGVRAVRIAAWLNDREISFSQHCGTGCIEVSKVEVERLSYTRACPANVDGDLRWAPTGDRLAIEGHSGALILLDGSRFQPPSAGDHRDCSAIFQGCLGNTDTHWYAFEDWSPDGKQALLTRHVCKNPTERHSRGDLHVLDAGARQTVKLLPDATLGAWSPDGSRVAFVRFGEASYQVGVLALPTREVQEVARFNSASPGPQEFSWFRPLWSPNGQRLVLRDEKGDLWLAKPDGSRQRPITRGRPVQPSWSPDGKWLALTVGYEHPDPMPLAIVELP